MIDLIKENQHLVFLIVIAVIFFVIYIVTEVSKGYSIDKIKRRTVGDGQHGTARFATKKEISKTHLTVDFQPKQWRQGKNLPTEEGFIFGMQNGKALLSQADNHVFIVAGPGGGKTTGIMCTNIEYALATGNSFVNTDSKGDLLQWYGRIAAEDYGYTIFVIDFRNPMESQGNNLLYQVNSYFDEYKQNGSLRSLSLAEKHAKIIAKAVLNSGGFSGGGQNSYFYESAEGLITAVCLLVTEFCASNERHIVTVFKLILEFLAPAESSTSKNKKTVGQEIMEYLPAEHKARWFSGAALNSSAGSSASVITTAMSRLLSFIDSAAEQILCFDPPITTEQLCNEKVAVFIVFPEEDKTKHVLVSLMLQQMYNSVIAYADEFTENNSLTRRLWFFEDEFAIFPKQDNLKDMAAAGRSRNAFLVLSAQARSQISLTYGDLGAKAVMDCCKSIMFGGFSPLSDDAEYFSKILDTQTVAGGSVSNSSSQRNSGSSSKSVNMISRRLMTADELRRLPQFSWGVMHSAQHPFISKIPHWKKQGITFDKPFKVPQTEPKRIYYGNHKRLKTAIIDKYGADTEPMVIYDSPHTPDDGYVPNISPDQY